MCEDAFHSADSSAFGHCADNAQELLHMLSTQGEQFLMILLPSFLWHLKMRRWR